MYKILLVEDDALVSMLYQRVFTLKGCEVVAAYDGFDGLNQLAKAIPDIILLDLMMPTMSGLDMLERLQASDDHRHIPVFILSNLSDPKKIEECLQKGAKQFLVKSQYLPEAILEKVVEYLESSSKNLPPQE